eukprot:scaffold77100_cov66-Phaeocystis_antarctica.AAC.2
MAADARRSLSITLQNLSKTRFWACVSGSCMQAARRGPPAARPMSPSPAVPSSSGADARYTTPGTKAKVPSLNVPASSSGPYSQGFVFVLTLGSRLGPSVGAAARTARSRRAGVPRCRRNTRVAVHAFRPSRAWLDVRCAVGRRRRADRACAVPSAVPAPPQSSPPATRRASARSCAARRQPTPQARAAAAQGSRRAPRASALARRTGPRRAAHAAKRGRRAATRRQRARTRRG